MNQINDNGSTLPPPPPSPPTTTEWEPLPPRGSNSNRARRHERRRKEQQLQPEEENVTNATPKNNSKSNKQQRQRQQQPKKPKNRPGYNSYLKVNLDDQTMNQLHSITLNLQKYLQRQQQTDKDNSTKNNNNDDDDEKLESNNNNNNNESQQASTGEISQQESVNGIDDKNQNRSQQQPQKKRKQQRPLSLKPRPRTSLHMTFFFGGETLCALPSNELEKWHADITTRFAKSGFCLSSQQEPTTSSATTLSNKNDTNFDIFSFEVSKLCVFPPQRKNLIVAILNPTTTSWDELHHDIRNIAKDCGSQGLLDVTSFSKDKWIAHITLGNLMGGTKNDIAALSKLLDDPSFVNSIVSPGTICDNNNDPSMAKNELGSANNLKSGDNGLNNNNMMAYTSGISMGGPTPSQSNLDWDFKYTPNQANTQ